jgi:hypothetical protein
MNLRKIFDIMNSSDITTLVDETLLIKQRCDEIASQEYKEQKENQRTHDSRCPKCRADKDKIVDKIAKTSGKGKVDGSFYLGFGSISGSMDIDTDSVNHCNVCGHEWEKFKTKYVSKTDILRVTLKYLSDMISNPTHNRRLSWKIEAIKVFDGCHAEAITLLVKEEKRYVRSKNNLRNIVLRKYYPSIFDGENKKELRKL